MRSDSLSRRAWLKRVLVSAAVVFSGVLPDVAPAESRSKKVTKASVHYQDHPDAGKMCGMCRYFIPPGGRAGHGMMGGAMMGGGMMGQGMGPGMMKAGQCQLVQGRISPMGYCDLYTPV